LTNRNSDLTAGNTKKSETGAAARGEGAALRGTPRVARCARQLEGSSERAAALEEL